MRVFQIGGDINLVQRHERAVESHLARDEAAQLAFQEFVYAE